VWRRRLERVRFWFVDVDNDQIDRFVVY